MAKQTINIGSTANDGTGDPLRTAFNKANENFTEVYDIANSAFAQANTGGNPFNQDLNTSNNVTFNEITASSNVNINVLNLRDSNLNLDGGSGSFYWSGQSGVAQAGDLKAGVYSSDPASNNSLFTFGGAGANNMSVGIEGSLFIGTAMPSNDGGLNTTFPGWLVVQSGAKFGGTLNTLGALQFDDPATANVIFADNTRQNTAFTLTPILDSLTVNGSSKLAKVVEPFSDIADATGVVTHDCTNNHIFYHTSLDANFTANFTNLSLANGEATSLTLVLDQGGTAYIANNVQIGGEAQTIKWSANTVPTGNTNAVDVQSFSVLRVSGNYIVLGQLSTFG